MSRNFFITILFNDSLILTPFLLFRILYHTDISTSKNVRPEHLSINELFMFLVRPALHSDVRAESFSISFNSVFILSLSLASITGSRSSTGKLWFMACVRIRGRSYSRVSRIVILMTDNKHKKSILCFNFNHTTRWIIQIHPLWHPLIWYGLILIYTIVGFTVILSFCHAKLILNICLNMFVPRHLHG